MYPLQVIRTRYKVVSVVMLFLCSLSPKWKYGFWGREVSVLFFYSSFLIDPFSGLFVDISFFMILRLQAQPINNTGAYTGMFDAFRKTFRDESFRGFYKGLIPNLLKVVPAASITYMVYEYMKKNLDLE